MIKRFALAELCRAVRPNLYLALSLVLCVGAPERAWTQTLVAISVTAPSSSLPLGNTMQFAATGIYSDGSTRNLVPDAAAWSSSDPAVAAIQVNTGTATPVAPGTADIVATFSGILGSFTLTVTSCVQDAECTDINLCTRDTCETSTGICRHNLAVDCSAPKGACYQPGVCAPATGQCGYVPLSDGDSCKPNPEDSSCALYSCENMVCTKQCLGYTFSGFFPPVQNSPILNGAKAGSAIPIKFSLNGDQGLNILAEGYPTSQQVNCANVGTLQNMPTETVSPGASTLSYDAASNQYTYVWKTDKAWAGTCRQFVLRLTDGSIQIPYFQFK
jgi:Big-like domain-containing protein